MVIKVNIKVGISNRHVHLTKEAAQQLFGYENLTEVKDLSQIGEFASNEFVTIKTKDAEINNVRVVGPTRNYIQVEITKTDAYKLRINPPVRESGDLENSETVTLIGPKGQLEAVCSTIIANRHIHINTKDIEKYNLKDGQIVSIKINGEKSGIINNVKVKSSNTFTFELHLDTDDANAFLLNNGGIVEIIKGEDEE